ncbi:hypothetical protein [Haliscomenobacter sp.]|uniref:HYC_CC_PP family protein n=1 Tax=Haliscomenobacter sp. TaxID=2717303 RepID=UPI003593C452
MFKLLHLILAINVLFSSTGITVFEHLCQMKGKTVSVFTKPKACCKRVKTDRDKCQKDCCSASKTQQQGDAFSKKNCCQDKSQLFKSNIDGALQKIALPDLNVQIVDFEPLPFALFSFEVIPISQKALRFYLYKPPPKVTDIRVFIQSFLC